MGCWNKTCGLTNLPIMVGDPVIAFLLVENEYSSRNTQPCYTSEFWNYIPLPIYGEYNDYGWIENVEGQEHKLAILEDIFGSRLIRNEPKKEGNYVRYPGLEDTPFDSFENLGKSIHGGVFSITAGLGGGRDSNIAAFFIHRDVFNQMVAQVHTDEWSSDEIIPRELAVKTLTDFITYYRDNNGDSARLRELMRRLKEDDASFSDDECNELTEMSVKFLQSSYGMGSQTEEFSKTLEPQAKYPRWDSRMVSARFWFDSRNSGSAIGYATSSFCTDIVRNNIVFDIAPDELYDGAMLLTLMSGLRKTFFPQGGEGSQAGAWGLHEQFAEVFSKKVHELVHKYDEDEEDEETSEEE